MNRNTLLAGALLLLLAAILLPRLMTDGQDYPERLALVDSAAVDYIHIVSRQDSVTLTRAGGVWTLAGSPTLPADTSLVARLLEQLSNLDVVARAHDNRDLAQDRRFQLDADGARHVVVRQGDSTVLDARFGKSSDDFSACFARLEGEEPIFRLATNVSGRLNARRSPWMLRQLYDFNPDSLLGLTVFHPDGSREEYRLADSLWLADVILPDSTLRFDDVPVNPGVLAGLKSGVARFRITDIAPDSLVAGVNPDSAAVRVEFMVAGGGRHGVAWYHSPKAETRKVCRLPGRDTWYEVHSSTMKRYLVDPGEVVQVAP